MSQFCIVEDTAAELVGGGSVIDGATLSSFFVFALKAEAVESIDILYNSIKYIFVYMNMLTRDRLE